jgi:hypothetical protein
MRRENLGAVELAARNIAFLSRVSLAAFTIDPVSFDASWREAYDTFHLDCPGFDDWRALIIRQIVGLREMAETEVLTNEYRYFGISAPRGS